MSLIEWNITLVENVWLEDYSDEFISNLYKEINIIEKSINLNKDLLNKEINLIFLKISMVITSKLVILHNDSIYLGNLSIYIIFINRKQENVLSNLAFSYILTEIEEIIKH